MILVEKQFGHGGVKDKPDPRDYQYSTIAMATSPFDWSIGFDIETLGVLPVKNQYQSFSCGGQAWASYSYVLDKTNREEKSAKFIYSQTHVEGGGSDGRTNCDLCVKKGVSQETLCPSYLPDKTTTEAFMVAVGDITVPAYADATTNEEKSYFSGSTDIDSVAQTIRDNSGVVIGLGGQNNGTWLSPFPLPPTTVQWNHWVYAGKAKIINGKKYIGFLNSWGNSVGEKGWQWIGEDYFKNGLVWACWIMVYNNNVPYVFTKVLKFGNEGFDVRMLQTKLGIFVDGKFGKNTQRAVVAFQTKNGLKPDGIVGAKTNEKLNL